MTIEKQQEPVRQLLKDLRDETQTLIRQEVELVRSEGRQKARLITRQLVLIGIGAALLLAGFIEVLAAIDRGVTAWLVEGMNLQIAVWLAPLLVAALFLGIGAFLVMKALHALRDDTAPEHTMHSIQKTGRWARARTHNQRRIA